MTATRPDDNRFCHDSFPLLNAVNGAAGSFHDLFFTPARSSVSIRPDELRVKPTCETCNSENMYKDVVRGELICVECGSVIEDHFIDARGVRVYDAESMEKRVHHEPMTLTNRPIIKITGVDSATARRRARENNRMDWKDKKVIIMKIELAKVRNVLPFPKEVEDRTMEEIAKVFNTRILRGRSAIPMALALLYYSCIQCNSSIGLKDILDCLYADAENENEKRKIHKGIRSAIRTLSRELDYKFTIKKDYSKYLSKISHDLGIPYHACTSAIRLFKKLDTEFVFSGDPIGYAGACLYYSCKHDDDATAIKVTMKEISDMIKMTEVTVRKRVKEITIFNQQHGIDA